MRVARRFSWLPAFAIAAALLAATAFAENVDPGGTQAQYAYGENIGWLNAEPTGDGGPGVQVSGAKITGWLYGENVGWINLHCDNRATCATVDYGVKNNGVGKLSGYAYGENIGWISFSCANVPAICAATGNYGVTIDPVTRLFAGNAYGENVGWINFDLSTQAAARISVVDDGDGVDNSTDTCPFDNAANQTNTDNTPIVTPGVAPIDTTIPHNDKAGDVCDTDDDNDGQPDAAEPAGCNASAALNPLVFDTDGDRTGDAAECALGSNPTSAASKPQSPMPGDQDNDGLPSALETAIGSNPFVVDTDGDGINDGIEYRGYNTLPAAVETDADACNDDTEITDVTGSRKTDVVDLFLVAGSFGLTTRPNLDITKDGSINIVDLFLIAANTTQTFCPPQ